MTLSLTTRLLLDAKKGDQPALDQLYARIGSRLLALIRLRMGPDLRHLLDPEDVAQEVMLKAFDNIESFEKESSRSFFAWLAVIASRTIRDAADFHSRNRRDHRRLSGDSQPLAAARAPHRSALSQIIVDQDTARLERALASLSKRYREIILLREFEERSYKEIAKIMAHSEDGCRMLHKRALTKLTLAMQHD